MDSLTKFSIKNPTVIIGIALMLLFGGLYASGQLNRETMPDVSIPMAVVVTPYPGAAPADVYDKVTVDMEKAVSGVDDIESTQGHSLDSVSMVVAEFSYSTDMDKAEADIEQAIQSVDLPENAMDPTIKRISIGSAPIMKIAVTGGDSVEELSATVREDVVPELEAIDGVGEVQTTDDDPGKIRIVFDEDALEENGLTASDVMKQLQATNLSFPVGAVGDGTSEQPVRVSGTLGSVEDMKDFKVVIYPNPNEMYAEAFQTMGEGMGAIGEGMGALGQGVGQLGSAVGQIGGAVGEMGASFGNVSKNMGMQIGILSGIQNVQAELFNAKLALAEANAVLKDPTSTPEEIAQAQAKIAQLEQMIPALEATLAQLEDQLAQLQKEAMESSSTPPAGMPTDLVPPTGGAPAVPSAPSVAGDLDIEPAIEVVPLSDLAEVTFDSGAESMYSRADGEPAVLLDIVKSQDANTVSVAEAVTEEVSALNGDLEDAGVTADITYDASEKINDSINDIVREGMLGALFAFIIILLFLRNWRSTLVAAVSIPLSVISALAFIGFFDITLNIMTLGGLTVAIGRVVDDSIVVIENIYRHIQLGEERTPEMIRRATREVSSAITSSTLTTVAVFAPMAFVSGIVGKVFTPFAITVVLALLASLLVAVTIVPLIAKWTLLGAKVPPREEEQMHSKSYYARLMRWSLENRKAVIAAATLLFVLSVALVPVVGTGFMPPASEKYATVDVTYPTGTKGEVVDETLKTIEAGLDGLDDVVYYQSTVGQQSRFNFSAQENEGTVFIKFDPDVEIDEALAEVHELADPLKSDEVAVAVAQVDVTGGGSNSLELVVTGSDFDDISETADTIAQRLEGIEGLENVKNNAGESRPQITVDVDQAAAASYGINPAMVAGTVRGFVADQDAGTVDMDGEDVSLVYRTDIGDVTSAADIAAVKLNAPMGDTVFIGDIAEVEQTETPVAVQTLDEREYASVTAYVTERDSSSVISDIEAELATIDMPDGVNVEVAGMAEMMDDAFKQLGLAMLIAIGAVYLVMVIAFGEATAPLAIMFSLPLALIGSIVALMIAGIPLDMPAMIGALMLIGIVTTNAIVLIDRVQQKRAEGLPRKQALIAAGSDRIRPVLMTALTTIFALVPLAVGYSEGALISQSLAVTVVGGLVSSTALTLIVVPVVYDLLEGLRDKVVKPDRSMKDASPVA